jgi:ABC-type glycerol-3-phosphate transport system substrate-binding protein
MKKLLPVVSLLMVVSMLLAACAPAATPAAQPTQAGQAAAPAAEPTATQPAAAAEPTAVVNAFGKCDRPLKLMHGLTGTDGAVFATLLEQFIKENPDICISSEGFVWDTFFQKYPTAVAAGQPPDMVIFHGSEVQQMAAQGLMQPMDDVFTDGSLSAADYNPSLMKQITYNGKIMAVPFDNHGWLLWLNTKLVKDAGLDPENLPKNGEEFISWAQKLTTDKNGKHPTDAGFDKDNVNVWATEFTWPRYTMPSTFYQFGADVMSADGKKATLNSPEAVAAVQYWHDLMYKYYVSPPAIPGQTWAGDLFKVNRMVFMWEGTWTQGMMIDNPDVAAITKPLPLNSLAPDGKKGVKFDAHIFSVPTGVDQKGRDMAKKLMVWLAKNGAAWSKSGQVPANPAVQQDPVVQSHPSVVAAAAQFKEFGRTDTAASSPKFLEIQTAWETAVGNALASPTADVKAELQKGNDAIQAILDRP